MQTAVYDLLYYVYVLFFGVYVSIRLSCGRLGEKHWKLFGVSSVALLMMQGIITLLLGMETVRMLYPLIAHLPIVLSLVFCLKAKWDVALTSVITSYALCQLTRWVGLMIGMAPLPPLLICIIHICFSQLLLFLLDKYMLGALHEVLRRADNAVLHFGALPIVYYAYEYFMIYTQYRYSGVQALSELLPTGLVLFFTMSVAAYQKEMEKRETAEYQLALLETELSGAGQVIDSLRSVQEQTAVYRHDLHHHLRMIDSFLSTNQPAQAMGYIREVQSGLEAISPVRYCENETVNLILGSYMAKASAINIPVTVRVALPAVIALPDTELCAMLSNGMENALNAVKALAADRDRTIQFSCEIKQNTLLIQIVNPCEGNVCIESGIPVSSGGGNHYGCRSIRAIAQRRHGQCAFDIVNGQFVLRVAIPMLSEQ